MQENMCTKFNFKKPIIVNFLNLCHRNFLSSCIDKLSIVIILTLQIPVHQYGK